MNCCITHIGQVGTYNQLNMKSLTTIGLILLLAVGANQAAEKSIPKKPKTAGPNPMTKNEDTPGLPRVLLIGDSISIGYTLPVRELLKGKANVHRIPENGGPTVNGLKKLAGWLGTSKWDVIHFNWGLHDLKYIGTNRDVIVTVTTPEAHQQVPLPEYEANLKALVDRLKTTGAKLVWCSTTPVPEGANGRVPGDEVKYNEAATRVMTAAGVPTNDLYQHAKNSAVNIQLKADVHYTPAGYKYLAERVAWAIESQWPAK
jgi:lysophospholipase L1-like esterase